MGDSTHTSHHYQPTAILYIGITRIVLLECFAGKKPLRISQISRERSGKDRVFTSNNFGFVDFIVVN